jgi:hypothetical protein
MMDNRRMTRSGARRRRQQGGNNDVLDDAPPPPSLSPTTTTARRKEDNGRRQRRRRQKEQVAEAAAAAVVPPPLAVTDDANVSAAEGLLERYYFDDNVSRGILPTTADLAKRARQLGLPHTIEKLRRLKYKWRNVARFKEFRRPPLHATAGISKLGNVMVDLAYFHPEFKVTNRQCEFFLVAVDTLSQKLAAVPMVNRGQKDWEKAVMKMVFEDFGGAVNTIITDRDVAVAGKSFQAAIKRKYGIDWVHLPDRSKACHAEKQIHFLKTRLSLALNNNPRGDNNWVRHLPGILADYNAQFVRGTKIRRRDVTRANYMEVIRQQLGGGDPVAAANLGMAGGNFSPHVDRALWKYPVGSRVLVAKKSTHAEREGGKGGKKGTHYKTSVDGTYSFRSYKVAKHVLKHNWKQFLIPMYRLEGLRTSIFYEQDLIPALFSETGPRAEAETARESARKKTEERRRARRSPNRWR